MARPVASGYNANSAVLGAGGTLSISHTGVANVGQLLLVGCNQQVFFDFPFVEAATWNGQALQPRYRWTGSLGPFCSIFGFVLPRSLSATATANMDFTCVKAGTYSGIVCNVTNWLGDLIMTGGYVQNSILDPKTVTRQSYGWGVNALQMCLFWGLSGASSDMTLSGTVGGVGDGLILNTQDADDAGDGLLSWTATRVSGTHISLAGLLLPSDEHARTGGGYFPMFQGSSTLSALSASDGVITGLPFGASAETIITAHFPGGIMPFAGTLRGLAIKGSTTPGGSRTITAEIWRGGASSDIGKGISTAYPIPTDISLVLGSGDTTAKLTDAQITALGGLDWAKYERLYIRYYVTGAGSLPNPYTITSSLFVESGERGVQCYGGSKLDFFSSATVDLAHSRAPLHPDCATTWGSPTQDDGKSLIGVSETVEELIVDYQEDTPVTPDHQYYCALNGTLQDSGGGSIDTTATLPTDTLGRAVARSRFSLGLVASDLLGINGFIRAGFDQNLRQAATIRCTAVTAGEFMWSGHTSQAGTSDYTAMPNSPRTAVNIGTSLEQRDSNIIPPLGAAGDPTIHILGLRNYLEPTGPGTGRTLTERLRVNFANTTMPDLAVTGSPAAPIHSVTGGDVPVVEDDLVSTFWFQTNPPLSLARQFYTIPGFILPPGSTGTIIVVKDAGGNTSQVFGFTAGGGLSPTFFQLTGGQSQVFADLPPAAGYSVEELLPAGWTLVSVTVSNGDPPTSITVGEDEVVTVTFVNAPTADCPGVVDGQRIDGPFYRPQVPIGAIVTFNGEIVTFNGEPITFGDCGGAGTRSGSRTGQ